MEEAPKKPKATKSKKLYWVGPTYIRGWGTTGPGEVVTAEQKEAWKAATDVKLGGDYVTDKAPE
jgi:hypothetical protein